MDSSGIARFGECTLKITAWETLALLDFKKVTYIVD